MVNESSCSDQSPNDGSSKLSKDDDATTSQSDYSQFYWGNLVGDISIIIVLLVRQEKILVL